MIRSSKLVSPLQFGFVGSRSSLQQLLLIINSVVEAHELSTPTNAIYFDMRKAFDFVPHNDLLTKHGLWVYVEIFGIGSGLVTGLRLAVCRSIAPRVQFYTFGATITKLNIIFLNSNTIDLRESIKNLGVMITYDLSWYTHCNMFVSKAYKQLSLIHQSFTTICSNYIFLWCTYNLCVAPRFGDLTLLKTYSSWKKFNGEPQSIF